MHLGFLATALSWHGPISSLVGVVFGVSMMTMGNVMPRLRPNSIAGLRSDEMLGNSTAWRNAHASFGRMWVVGGVLVVATALFAPRYSLIAFVTALILSLLVASMVTRRALNARNDAVAMWRLAGRYFRGVNQ